MKKTGKVVLVTVTAIVSILLIALFFPTWTSSIAGDHSISTMQQVKINGTNQEIMIRGQDKRNPVLLFVHGGPGNSEIPYAKKYQHLLEKNFTVVNYDQRGTGKSYHFNEDHPNISSDLLADDLIAITDYLKKNITNKKVILVGHSYGTYVATQAAAKAPEKYEAYVGIGQMSNTVESEMDSLDYVLKQATKAENKEDITAIKKVQSKVENGEAFTPRDLVMKYGGGARQIDNPEKNLFQMALTTEYNLLDAIGYLRGIGFYQFPLVQEALKNPLTEKVTAVDLPVYFVMGKYDYMTSAKAAKNYFDSLDARQKEFLTFKKSAHYPQFEEPKKFSDWMVKTFK
ncbi:alpha/beta hydrolase [Priestia koreensis]|uniref:alpha/beta fold hydrolase n=1 Tax=Priestia koreensis TaxID=284581 RepID=UPI003019F214